MESIYSSSDLSTESCLACIDGAITEVAAVSGDARRALDICRRATELAQAELTSKGGGQVGMQHVDRAIHEMFCSAKVMAVRCASLHEKMFLRGVLAEFRRNGLEEAMFKQVHQQLQMLYKMEGLRAATMSELSAICSRLGASRLLLVEGSRRDLHRRIRLNISQDDIIFALRDSTH